MDGERIDDRTGERGATLVQYVLLVVLLALVVVTAASKMGSGSKQSLDAARSGVAAGEVGGNSGESADGSGGGSGGSVGSSGTTPTTAVATTAAPATTTTKAPTTTTTAAPTTTTTTSPPKVVGLTFTSSQGIADSTSLWHGKAEGTVSTTGGEVAPGAEVDLVIEGWSSTGGGGTRRTSKTASAIADSSGKVVIDTGTLARSGTSRVNSVTIQVASITVPSGFTWNGATPSATINRV